MLLRQVQARPLQGDHLRALRRRGDAAEGAPRADGSHRPGRAGLAHLVLQGRPEPDRLPARHRPARAREGALLRRLDRHRASTSRRARRTSPTSRTRCGPSPSRSTSTATSALAALEERLQRRRDYFAKGKEQGLRRGRRLLGPRPRQLGRGAGCCRRSRRRARSPAGIFPELAEARSRPRTRRRSASSSATTATRDDRKLAPRELEPVATAAEQIQRGARARSAPSSRRRPGSKKGALTKHVNKIVDALLAGDELDGRGRRARRRRRREEPREGARGRQRPARRRARRGRRRAPTERRARARVRPLPATEGAQKDDLDAVVQWALKVREMYADIESRREDAREAAVDARPPARGDVAAASASSSRRRSSTTSSSSAS